MRQQKEGRWLAWHSGLLANFKHPPGLGEFVGGGQTAPKPQSPDQMLAIAQQWAALTPAKGERRSRS